MTKPFTVKVDDRDVRRMIRELSEKDAPFVTAYALTKTAQDIKAAEVKSMESTFDRPKKFTLNSLYVKTATKANLNAEVFFKDGNGKTTPGWKYLGPQVLGGSRNLKSHERRLIRAGVMKPDEFAVPGKGVALDAYGNIAGGTIERILSQLHAAEQWAGYQANATKQSLKRAKKKNVGRYFLLRPGGPGPADRNVAPGIYYRAGLRDIVPILLFVRAPQYAKRLPFFETADTVFKDKFVEHAQAGFKKYVLDKNGGAP